VPAFNDGSKAFSTGDFDNGLVTRIVFEQTLDASAT
jgi:hypothetical protein